jgi:stearoyl-CoA desaturase (delta-9 desaturase)
VRRATAPAGERSVTTCVALAAIHLAACAAVLPVCFSWSAVFVALTLFYLTGSIGICLGYHRLLTHRSFHVPRVVEYTIVTAGALALEGGPIEWVSTHRAHHKFSDTARDPHDSRLGFFWSHVGWLYRRNPARLSIAEQHRYAGDLYKDAYYRFLEKGTPAFQIILGVLLFIAGGWPWVFWGIFVRLVMTYHATWLVNSAAHLAGYRTYLTPGLDRSTNNWWVALIASGEGWHNNHHAFPSSARHGLAWFEFDLTWLAIAFMRKVGIARDVLIPDEAMLRRRLISTSSSQVDLEAG